MTNPTDLFKRCDGAVLAAEKFLAAARSAVAAKVTTNGKLDAKAIDREQRAVHAFAWYATYVEALRQMARWARKLDGEKRFGEIESLILQCAFGEYLAQMAGGIAMSQGEIARPYNMGVGNDVVGEYWNADVDALTRTPMRECCVTVVADRCAVADALTKILMADAVAAAPLLDAWNAEALVFDAGGDAHLVGRAA